MASRRMRWARCLISSSSSSSSVASSAVPWGSSSSSRAVLQLLPVARHSWTSGVPSSLFRRCASSSFAAVSESEIEGESDRGAAATDAAATATAFSPASFPTPPPVPAAGGGAFLHDKPNNKRDDDTLDDDVSMSKWVLDPDVRPHVRVGLSTSSIPVAQRDTGLSVCLLGTGAGSPTLFNSNPCTAIRMGSITYLFDAGEGVQVQLMKSRIRGGDIAKIFVTHMHGDHVLGLPGLLLMLAKVVRSIQQDKHTTAGRKKNRVVVRDSPRHSHSGIVHVYGPEGLYPYLVSSLLHTHASLGYLRVVVHELVGTCAGSACHPSTGAVLGRKHSGPSSSAFPRVANLTRRTVLPDQGTGVRNAPPTWTLETPLEFTEMSQVQNYRPGEKVRGVSIQAAELDHVPNVPCFGYVLREPQTQPRPIDPQKAISLGVKPGPKFSYLKFGFSVSSDTDPSVTIHPDQVCMGDPDPVRSVAVLGDCKAVPETMAQLCQNVDILIHEATLCELDSPLKIVRGGHSTAAMAGKVAHRVQPKVLLLNHISSTLRHEAAEQDLALEAERQLKQPQQQAASEEKETEDAPSPPSTRVQIGYDHLEILVPRNGFPW